MKNNSNINTVLGILCLLSAILFNQITWSMFSGDHLSLYIKSTLGIVDLFLIISGLLFLKNHNHEKFFSNYIKIVSFNSIFLILLLVVVEIIFGNWFSSNKLNQLNIIKDDQIQYNLQGLYPAESDTIIYSRDEWGFRGTYPDVQNIDILTIGGSTTDQRYISDGDTFQDILQNEFKNNGKDVYVVNAGVDGQSTFGHIKNFDWWFPHIPNLKVKYILFYIGVNDFYKDDNYLHDDLLGESLANSIRARSALYYLYRTIEGINSANAYGLSHNVDHGYYGFSTKDWVEQPNLSNYEAIMEGRLDAYEKRLDILCKKVESVGSVPIFVTQSMRRTYSLIDGRLLGNPNVGEYDGRSFNGVDYYYMSRLLNERTKAVCMENGCIFVNLDQELEFDLQMDFYDNAHNTPSGAKKIGKYLYTKLNNLF